MITCLPYFWQMVRKPKLLKLNLELNMVVPFLFIVYVGAILQSIKDKIISGINIIYRTDGKLFNPKPDPKKNFDQYTSGVSLHR